MRTINLFAFALLTAGLMSSCGNTATTASDAENAAAAGSGAVSYTIDAVSSELQWHGSKLAYGHSGLINITDGSLSIENGNLSAGNFTIDMKTMKETGNPDAEGAAKLVGHLSSPDFFDVEKHPTSKFEVTGSTAQASDTTTHLIKGNLTIKGVTKNIEFPAKVTVAGDDVTATASFTVNRNDWGVTYGSGLSGAIGDNIIGDNIDYKVSLKGKKAAAEAPAAASH
jgi:polyisoprenoid-binding protein YceI